MLNFVDEIPSDRRVLARFDSEAELSAQKRSLTIFVRMLPPEKTGNLEMLTKHESQLNYSDIRECFPAGILSRGEVAC